MARSTITDRYKAIIPLLIESRRAAGMTQVQLASKLERPQSYVSKVERGERRVDAVEFADFAMALGVEPIRLFEQLLLAVRLRDG